MLVGELGIYSLHNFTQGVFMSHVASGIGTLIFFMLLTGMLMSYMDGSFLLWLWLLPGIFVGLIVAGSIK